MYKDASYAEATRTTPYITIFIIHWFIYRFHHFMESAQWDHHFRYDGVLLVECHVDTIATMVQKESTFDSFRRSRIRISVALPVQAHPWLRKDRWW